MNRAAVITGIIILGAGFWFLPQITRRAQQPQTAFESDHPATPTMAADPAATGRYVPYSELVFHNAKGKRRVYFFHAVWCPTCKTANEDFTAHPDSIPADVVVFKTDYDTETDLKKQYAITYQHTFVQVDDDGNQVALWSGGGIKDLVDNIR